MRVYRTPLAAVLSGLLWLCASAQAQMSPKRAGLLDAPLPPTDVRQAQFAVGYVPGPGPDYTAQTRGDQSLQLTVPDLKEDLHPVTKQPIFVRSTAQLLGKPIAGTPPAAAKAFVTAHPATFGLASTDLSPQNCVLDRQFTGAGGKFTQVRYRQSIDGVDVDEGELRVNLTPAGEVINASCNFVPNGRTTRNTANPTLAADQAVVKAGLNIGAAIISAPAHLSGPSGPAQLVVYQGGNGLVRGARARLLYFPMSPTETRLAWEVIVRRSGSGNQYRVVVDAANGTVLQRVPLTVYAASQTITLNVYTNESPTPFLPGLSTTNSFQASVVSRASQTLISLDSTASPNGWINDGDNTTAGNNAIAFAGMNTDGTPVVPSPTGSPSRVFDFALDLTQDPASYADASIVNLFYWANFMHDKLYELGFDEASGNYQADNFGRGGLSNDVMLVEAQANEAGTDNSQFVPAPDGESGQVQMFVFTGPSPQRDGALDVSVVLHELTHGLSERLVGNGSFITALQSAGMGEGWSDFYALSLLSKPDQDVNGTYQEGAYVSFNILGIPFDQNYYFGVRRYPYTTDLTKNPLTLKDIDPAQISLPANVPLNPIFGDSPADEVHAQGEVWCSALWECRALLIEAHGFAGNQLLLQLVTDGMKLGPPNPTFLEARDAIIQADVINNGGANVCILWKGFAKRGMGFSAQVPNADTTAGVVEAFDIPNQCTVDISQTIINDTIGGNGNGFIEGGETISLQVVLERPAGLSNTLTGISAALASATRGITIIQTNSLYPDIPAGTVRTNTTPYVFKVATNVVCGSQINFSLQVASDDGAFALPFVMDVGASTNVFGIDFESGLGGITIDNTGNGLWHLSGGHGTLTGHSKTNSIYYGQGENDNGGGNYDTGTANRGTFTLPPIDLLGINGRVLLTFNHLLGREGAAPGNFDVAKLELSKDGGVSYVTIAGPFTTTGGEFQRVTLDLSQYINNTVLLRFSFDTIDQQHNDFEGWYVDDILIRAFDCPFASAALAGQVVAQGTETGGGGGVFKVTDGTDGANLLTQAVLAGAPHTDFRAFAVGTAAGNEAVAVSGVRNNSRIDFEVHDGKTGAQLASGTLAVGLTSEYDARAGNVRGGAAEQLLFIASYGDNAPVLDVRDSGTGSSLYSTPVLDPACRNLSVVVGDMNGDGTNDVIVIGQHKSDGVLVADFRNGPDGARRTLVPLKRTQTAPYVAFASDLIGAHADQLVLLTSTGGGAVLSVVDGRAGRLLANKTVLKSAANNLRAFDVRIVPGARKQVAVLGSNAAGNIFGELWSPTGKRLSAFALVPQVVAPFEAVRADVNGDGVDEIVLSAVNRDTGKPILLALNAVSGGSLYVVNPFESETVSNVKLFSTDLNGDGAGDVVLSATRDDGVTVFEARAGVSGELFSSFNLGASFVGPPIAFGARVGE